MFYYTLLFQSFHIFYNIYKKYFVLFNHIMVLIYIIIEVVAAMLMIAD